MSWMWGTRMFHNKLCTMSTNVNVWDFKNTLNVIVCACSHFSVLIKSGKNLNSEITRLPVVLVLEF